MNTLIGKDILHGSQFSKDELELIMDVAQDFKKQLERTKNIDLLKGYLLASLFFEPSTRTRLSFEAAIHRLGGSAIGFSSAESTSVSKGETLEDTVRTVDQYVDFIAVRHPAVGSASRAAQTASHPVLNGGDGTGQHPTQALLDLFTIKSELGKVEGKTIILCGDLKNGRTVHSGVEVYKHYHCRLILVSPEALQMPAEVTDKLISDGLEIVQTTDLTSAIRKADVLYMTRIQKERFSDPEEYESVKGSYILTREMIHENNDHLVVLHPLPRVNEISTDVDDFSGAAYFRQAQNGVFIRMALLALVAGKIS